MNAGGDLIDFLRVELRERFQKYYIDTGVFSPTCIFNLFIKQEGLLSQQVNNWSAENFNFNKIKVTLLGFDPKKCWHY